MDTRIPTGSGQLVPKTTRTQDNSYPRQLVPRTTRTQDNSYPRQIVPRTTRTQVNSYPCGMIWNDVMLSWVRVVLGTSCLGYELSIIHSDYPHYSGLHSGNHNIVLWQVKYPGSIFVNTACTKPQRNPSNCKLHMFNRVFYVQIRNAIHTRFAT